MSEIIVGLITALAAVICQVIISLSGAFSGTERATGKQ